MVDHRSKRDKNSKKKTYVPPTLERMNDKIQKAKGAPSVPPVPGAAMQASPVVAGSTVF